MRLNAIKNKTAAAIVGIAALGGVGLGVKVEPQEVRTAQRELVKARKSYNEARDVYQRDSVEVANDIIVLRTEQKEDSINAIYGSSDVGKEKIDSLFSTPEGRYVCDMYNKEFNSYLNLTTSEIDLYDAEYKLDIEKEKYPKKITLFEAIHQKVKDSFKK